MARSSNVEIENSVPQDPLAIELANLRHYFSPASIIGAGLPSEMDRASMSDTLVDRRSPLPLDNAFVQQTKDQIRAIVESIAKLAHAPIEPNEFVLAVLPKVASAMGATGAALWQQFPDLTWRLLGNLNLPNVLLDVAAENNSERPAGQVGITAFEQLDFLETQLRAATEATPTTENSNDQCANRLQPSESHLSVLNAVARERQPILIPPCDALLNRDRPINPTSELLIYAPLLIPKEQGNYWLQIVQSPSGGPASQRGYLRFVAQMADLMSDYFRSHRLRVFERDREYLKLAQNIMNELASTLNPKLGVAKLMKSIREHAQSEHAEISWMPCRSSSKLFLRPT